MNDPRDPFKSAREQDGILSVLGDGEDVSMILRLKDLRKAAKDWKQFSSDHPLRVLIHSEAHVRSVRQLPIETDPPDHTDYREIVEPLFRRPTEPAYIEDMEALVDRMVKEALAQGVLEAVEGFALPLQSRALTRLFGMPESEAEEWIRWGIHVFLFQEKQREDGKNFLEKYTAKQFARAEENPGEDFFSILNRAEFRGRPLTLEEKQGFANVAFAGGRDTVINTITGILGYFAEHPEGLDFLREDPDRIPAATEEFVRFISPLTSIARSCPHGAQVGDHSIPPGGRAALCWPSANRDGQVFQDPDKVILNRCPNPHVGFGFGTHTCLGAAQARLVIRSLLKSLCRQVHSVKKISEVWNIETESSYTRRTGHHSLTIRLQEK